MTKRIRDIYRIQDLNINEVNRILARITDRLDKLQGDRGNPEFYSNIDVKTNRITNVGQATDTNDALVNKLGNTVEISNENLQVKYNTSKALTDTTSGLEVNANNEYAIDYDADGKLKVLADGEKALTIDTTNGLQVIADTSKALTIDTTNGLQVIADTTKGVDIDATAGIQVKTKSGGGLDFDSGELYVDMPSVSIDADQVDLDTTGYTGIIPTAATDVQLAMDAIDTHTHAHSSITNLTTGDGHTQYALLAGRTGQTLHLTTLSAYDANGLNIVDKDDVSAIFVKDGGYVGIANANPAYPLDLAVSSVIGIRVQSSAALGTGSGGAVALFATPYPTAADQRIGKLSFGADDGSNIVEPAVITGFSEEAFVYASNRATQIRFETTTGTTRSEKMRIAGNGNIGLNQTTFGTSAAKVLAIGTGTAPSSSPADAVQLWSADRGSTAGKAGLHIRSEDGTSHVFSDYVGIGTITPTYPLEVSGNTKITGNIGINANPATTASDYLITVSKTYTDDTASSIKRSLDFAITCNPASAATVYYQGINHVTDVPNTVSYNLNGYIMGMRSIAYFRPNTTLATLYGYYCYVGTYNGGSDSSGTITTLYGMYITGAKTASSTITTAYGLYITGISGTTAYDIYCAGASNRNYFAGNVMIGATAIIGTSGTKTLGISTGTTPTSAPADACQLFSKDANGAAGKAALHTIAECGTSPLVVAAVELKTTTGDSSEVMEGKLMINTFDNVCKIYADGAWRTIASGW